LITNPTLLQIARLGRAAKPLDLMTYSAEDEQPGVFFLRESARQSVLAVFNWTGKLRSHAFTPQALGLAAGHPYHLYDALNQDAPLDFDGNAFRLEDQAAHSVRLIKIIDESEPTRPPDLNLRVPARAQVREDVTFSAYSADNEMQV